MTEPQWPGGGLVRGQAGYIEPSAFRAAAERLRALAREIEDAEARQIFRFLSEQCEARARQLLDARAKGFLGT